MRNRMENNYKTSNHTQDTPARTYIYNNNTFSRTVQSKFKSMSRRMSTSSSTTHTHSLVPTIYGREDRRVVQRSPKTCSTLSLCVRGAHANNYNPQI